MRNMSLMMAATALLVAGGIASAQLAVLPGQDIDPSNVESSSGSGYGAPYSPRNAPAADATNDLSTDGRATSGQAPPTFEDRWPGRVGVPYLLPDASLPNATAGEAQTRSAPASRDVPYIPD